MGRVEHAAAGDCQCYAQLVSKSGANLLSRRHLTDKTTLCSHLLNEIMPMIYKRFTEKAAEEWRQIYKALQLLEFLIKNGSERVIDDARGHLSLLKMLRQFHFIDQNGKDQGINVRNRSKELAELLSDVDRIRSERKKARTNRNKFGGVEGGAMSGGMSSRSQYGGFGSEDSGGYGGYSGGVYGDGGGFGGNESGFQDTQKRSDRFEEYDEADDGAAATPGRRNHAPVPAKKAEPPKPKEPEIDILGFDDDIPPETPPKEFNAASPISNGKRPAGNGLGGLSSMPATNDDDDFDDFQSATPTLSTGTTTSSIPNLPPPMPAAPSTQFAAPTPMAPPQSANFSGFNTTSPAPSSTSGISSPPAPNYNINMSAATSTFSPPPAQRAAAPMQPQQQQQHQQSKATEYKPTGPNYFTSVPAPQPANTATNPATTGRPTPSSAPSFSKPTAKASAGGGDAFGSLWNTASAGAGIKKTTTPSQGPNLASLQREKASQGIWGMGAAPPPQQQQPPSMGIGLPMGGAQSNGAGNAPKTGGAMDDLLG